MIVDPLRTSLLDLHHELRETGISLILAGGYGLYLKQLHLQTTGQRTAIRPELWPRPRSTEDLDLFLQAEVVANVEQMRAIRAALDVLGFRVVPDVKFMHFVKPIAPAGWVKVDLLTGPISEPAFRRRLHIKRPRVRPREQVELHAYLTDEAIAFDEKPFDVPIRGQRSTGEPTTAVIHVPQPFTFMLMKLHAFHDRAEDPDSLLGRHHALDLYRVVAMMTPDEYATSRELRQQHAEANPVAQAKQIVSEFFRNRQSLGVLRLREHELFDPAMDLDQFLSVLHEFFGQQ